MCYESSTKATRNVPYGNIQLQSDDSHSKIQLVTSSPLPQFNAWLSRTSVTILVLFRYLAVVEDVRATGLFHESQSLHIKESEYYYLLPSSLVTAPVAVVLVRHSEVVKSVQPWTASTTGESTYQRAGAWIRAVLRKVSKSFVHLLI